jgi:hypothetical protein
MINVEMLSYIEMYAGRCIVIFVGDDKQINPVGMVLGETQHDKLEYINDETALPYFYEN